MLIIPEILERTPSLFGPIGKRFLELGVLENQPGEPVRNVLDILRTLALLVVGPGEERL
jgi:hypothetical protein